MGMLSRRSAKPAAQIASVLLEEGERVEQLVGGRYLGESAVGLLTDRRFLVVNDREWRPDVRSIPIDPSVHVQGYGDDKSASLTFSGVGEPLTIESISDTALAREMAQRVRMRTGQA